MTKRHALIGMALAISASHTDASHTDTSRLPESIASLASFPDPILLDFTATWCGPCKQMEPILDEIAKERPSSVVVKKIDVDDHPDVAGYFEVRSIPTMILMVQGKVRGKLTEAVDKARLVGFIERSLAKK